MEANNTSQQTVYREVQPFRQVWIWAIVLGVAGIIWYGLVSQVMFHRPFGNNPVPDWLLIIFWLIFGLGFPVAAYYSRLTVEVRGDGVYYRYTPFHRSFRKISFADLQQCEARTYRPLVEYGGWGIRYGGRRGWAYTVSGNRGVAFELRDGRRVLLGSQQPERLVQAIQEVHPR